MGIRVHYSSELTQVLKAPREKVFQAYADFEAYPQWSSLYTRVTVTKREGNSVYLATEMKVFGRKINATEKHVLTPPEEDQAEVKVQSSTAKSFLRFEPAPEGTTVTWKGEGEVKGALGMFMGPIVKRQGHALVVRVLEELEKYVQAKK